MLWIVYISITFVFHVRLILLICIWFLCFNWFAGSFLMCVENNFCQISFAIFSFLFFSFLWIDSLNFVCIWKWSFQLLVWFILFCVCILYFIFTEFPFVKNLHFSFYQRWVWHLTHAIQYLWLNLWVHENRVASKKLYKKRDPIYGPKYYLSEKYDNSSGSWKIRTFPLKTNGSTYFQYSVVYFLLAFRFSCTHIL